MRFRRSNSKGFRRFLPRFSGTQSPLYTQSEPVATSNIETNIESPPPVPQRPRKYTSSHRMEHYEIFPVSDVFGTHVSTCTITFGEEENHQVEKKSPHLTVEIASKPDDTVCISTKESSGTLPFPTMIDFKWCGKREFAAIVRVPVLEPSMKDIGTLEKEVAESGDEFLKAAEDFKKGFLVIERYAAKLVALEMAKNKNEELEPNKQEMDPIYEAWDSYTK